MTMDLSGSHLTWFTVVERIQALVNQTLWEEYCVSLLGYKIKKLNSFMHLVLYSFYLTNREPEKLKAKGYAQAEKASLWWSVKLKLSIDS